MTPALILDSKRRTHEFQNEKENPRLIIISRHTLLEKKKSENTCEIRNPQVVLKDLGKRIEYKKKNVPQGILCSI